MAGSSGPKVDGTGQSLPKESMPKDSVNNDAHPPDNSNKGGYFKPEGTGKK